MSPPRSEPGRRRGRVFVVGSANEDIVVNVPSLPAPGETTLGTGISLLPGGKGANQAVAAARAGAEVVFVGAVGADDAGRRSLHALHSEGVDTSAVLVLGDAPTGTAVVTVAADGENQIAIVRGANGALTGAHVEFALSGRSIGEFDVCLVSFEIEDQAVAAAAASAHAGGAVLLVNPAPARPLVDRVRQSAPILLPNASEAEALSGARGTQAAVRLHHMTGRPVLVTLGADGVLLIDENGHLTLPSRTVDVVDTTGAGDTFAGVFAAMLAAGRPVRDAAERAVVAAGLSVTVNGARQGSPTADRIEEALLSLR